MDVALDGLPPDWENVRGELIAQKAERRLGRELVPDHRLFGVDVVAVAVRHNIKDVVYWLPVEQRWAWVHLTGFEGRYADFPWTRIADTWEELLELLPSRPARWRDIRRITGCSGTPPE